MREGTTTTCQFLGDADPGISSSSPNREEMHNALTSSPHSRSYQEKPTTTMQCPQRDRRGARAHNTQHTQQQQEADKKTGKTGNGTKTETPGDPDVSAGYKSSSHR
jgi:hypothetical protein